LVEALKKLCRHPSLGNRLLERDVDGNGAPPSREPVPWGKGAAEIYYEFSKKMDTFENSDRQRYELGMRACENAVRWATNIAAGRWSPTVDREDIAWAVKLSERSFEAAVGGVERYMQEYFEFPQFCDRILDALDANGGEMKRRDVLRKFGRKQRYGNELERVLTQLKKEERINFIERTPQSGGTTSTVIVLEKLGGP
jgi:DNA replicative helicase MCM subunit Mcm2 (Cdc46/Mcm family)